MKYGCFAFTLVVIVVLLPPAPAILPLTSIQPHKLNAIFILQKSS